MKKLMAIALITVLALSLLTACGGNSNTPSGGNSTTTPPASQGNDNTTSTPPSSTPSAAIDLSQFTAVELPASSLLEDWMKPEFGVVTSAGETIPDFMYQFTVSGVTKVNEESYRKLIEGNGFTKTSDYTYAGDKVKIALGTAGIETTSDSIMTVTIEKG